jgi:hypothetical membrane protein
MEETPKNSSLEIFKYNAILSALFFLTSTVYLGEKIPNYSFSRYTISQMSFFLNTNQLSFFNLLFIIKCLLDLSFTYYVFNYYKGKLSFVSSFIWMVAVLSFGLVGFFPESKFQIIHWIIAICLFLFWTISEHTMARITQSESFLYFSNNLILVQLAIVILFFALNQVNAIFEIIYFFLVFLWQIIFISRYLK